jgi:PadR family transcriptional regulator, regulatory protein PadR
MPPDRPQRVTLPTLQILAAFMSDLSRDDWYGRALSVHTGLGSGTVLQCLYRLENWGWLESRWEDRDVATLDGRPPRRFYQLTGVAQRQIRARRRGWPPSARRSSSCCPAETSMTVRTAASSPRTTSTPAP